MAGRKKKDDLQPVGGNLSHDNTTNELSDDQRHALTASWKGKYAAALAAKKTADANLKNVAKQAKSELGDNALADIKDLIAADEDENYEAKFVAELERRARIARWAGLEVGTQASLFDIGNTAPGLAEKAFNDGKRAGIDGQVLKPPHDAGSEAYNEYVRGWHEGTAIRTTTLREQEEGGNILLRPSENESSEPDELDHAADDGSGSEEVWQDDEAIADREKPEEI